MIGIIMQKLTAISVAVLQNKHTLVNKIECEMHKSKKLYSVILKVSKFTKKYIYICWTWPNAISLFKSVIYEFSY